MDRLKPKHPELFERRCQWEDIDNVIAGPRCVKRETVRYLPRLPGQKRFMTPNGIVDQYNDYLMRAVLLPLAQPLLARMVGMIFKREPETSLPPAIDELKPNWTLNGESFEAFAKLVVRENVSKGFGAICVDYSDTYARPFQRLYVANAVIDFDQDDVGGRQVLTSIELAEPYWRTKEDGTKCRAYQSRTIALGGAPIETVGPDPLVERTAGGSQYPFGVMTHTIRRESYDDKGEATGEWIVVEQATPTRRGVPLGFIPVVPFNPFAATWEICEPPMGDIIDMILADFLVSADYHELGHKVGAGTVLHASGFSSEDQKALGTIGGGSVVFTERADSKLSYIQTSGADSAVLQKQRQDIRDQLQAIVGRLLATQQKNVAESAASMEVQFSSEDANLQNIAGATAIALEEATKIAAWWAGTAETVDDVTDVDIELNDKFLTTQISVADMTGLGLEVEAGRFSVEDYNYEVYVKGERGRPGITEDERAAELDAAEKAKVPELIAPTTPEEQQPPQPSKLKPAA